MKYHANHDRIVATLGALCNWGPVRVIDTPLRRPCDYAVVVNGPEGSYTIAAAEVEAWKRVDAMMTAGFDFSAAYEREFDRNWALMILRDEKEGSPTWDKLKARIEMNAAIDAIVDALCHPSA